MKLFILNSKPADPNGYIFQALIRALCRRSDLQIYVISRDQLGQVSIDPQNQSLVVYGGEELHRIHREHILRPFGRRAVWFTEDPYEGSGINKVLRFFKLFLVMIPAVCTYIRVLAIYLAADPDLIPNRRHHKPDKLLFFSGTAWPNRKILINSLLNKWPNIEDLDLHLVRNQYVEQQSGIQALHSSLRFEEPISISEFGLRAANSICTLVVGRSFSGSGKHQFARSPGPRLFEAGITGSCQLVHASETPDMPAGLEEGRHFLRFSSIEQLVDLLHDASVTPDRFLNIGAAMAAEIKVQHTYDQRAAVLIEALLKCKTEVAVSTIPSIKRRVLFISHEQTKPGFQYGGAGICLDQIVSAAPSHVDVRILCRTSDDGHSFSLLDRYGKRIGGFRCHQRVTEFSLNHPELLDHVKNLLQEWQPQHVHLNHLLGFVPSIIPLIRNTGASVSITLHDYYAICDSWNLLDSGHKFCGIVDFFDDRCQVCCASRRPHLRSVDPIRRRIVMAEALASAHAVIVPSRAAGHQLREVLPHLPKTYVIEPSVRQPMRHLNPGEGTELVVLVPGNLAINKGYLELRRIIDQSNDIGLPIQFRILGRVEPWIEKELVAISNVMLLGRYDAKSFASKATGADLALFLSQWPETYCITFDEWKICGRACFYYALGALAEPHRRHGLHQASASFASGDFDGFMGALIQASTPGGMARLREPSTAVQSFTESPSFGARHWSLFEDLLKKTMELSQIRFTQNTHQQWISEHETQANYTKRQRLKRLIYRIPGGHKLALLWRLFRGR